MVEDEDGVVVELDELDELPGVDVLLELGVLVDVLDVGGGSAATSTAIV